MHQQLCHRRSLGIDRHVVSIVRFSAVLIDVADCVGERAIGNKDANILQGESRSGRKVDAVHRFADLDQVAHASFGASSIHLDISKCQSLRRFAERQLEGGFFASFECAQRIDTADGHFRRFGVDAKTQLVAGLQIDVTHSIDHLACTNVKQVGAAVDNAGVGC